MQEEIEQKSVALSINATKLTSRVLARAAVAVLKSIQKSQNTPIHGKQKVKQLARQNAGLSSIEINDKNIKGFDNVARKYGVDYALKRDNSSPSRWLVFFKARDADALTSAFKEFSHNTLKRQSKPSIRKILSNYKELIKDTIRDRQPKQRVRGDRGGPER